jgi:hypothetical protein
MQKTVGGDSLLAIFQFKSMLKQWLLLNMVKTKTMKKLLKVMRKRGNLGFFFFAAHQNSVYNAVVPWPASNFCHA